MKKTAEPVNIKKCLDSAEKIASGKKPAPLPSDRRAFKRHRYVSELAVVWLTNTNTAKGADITQVETEDISVGGMRIRCRRMLYPGSFGVIQIERADGSVALVGLEVIHTDYLGEMQYGSGCRFMPVPKSVIMRSFITQHGRLTPLRPGEWPPQPARVAQGSV